jgi:hypothetical protein
MIVTLCFRIAKHGFIDKATALLDRGNVCHVEGVLPNGLTFSAESKYGCDFHHNRTHPPCDWIKLDVACGCSEETMLAVCEAFRKDVYSHWAIVCFVLRIIGRFVERTTPTLTHNSRFGKWVINKWRGFACPSQRGWFCSELWARILTVCNGPQFYRDYLIGPVELLNSL